MKEVTWCELVFHFPSPFYLIEMNHILFSQFISISTGNSLSYHQRSPFSTFDSDNDASPSRNCALRHTGGWWFKNCMRSNLNGFYFPDGPHESYADGIEWSRFRGLKYSLKSTEMKIRPVAVTDNDI